MGMVYQAVKAVSIVAFLYYGLSVLFANAIHKEFERYGMARFRKLTGVLEIAGSLGLVAGYFVPGFTIAAAGGLSLLMALGVAIRLRSGDSPIEALQASAMLLINLFIVVFAWRFAGR